MIKNWFKVIFFNLLFVSIALGAGPTDVGILRVFDKIIFPDGTVQSNFYLNGIGFIKKGETNVISSLMITNDAITSAKIAPNTITTEDIGSSAVGNDELENLSITLSKLSGLLLSQDATNGVNGLKIKGLWNKTLQEPTASENGFVYTYDHSNSRFVLSAAGEGDMLESVFSTNAIAGMVDYANRARFASNAISLNTINVQVPTSSDDEEVLAYDHDINAYKHVSLASLGFGDMLQANYDTNSLTANTVDLADRASLAVSALLATNSAKIAGALVEAFVSGDDEQVLVYDHDSVSVKTVSLGALGGGDMLTSNYDTNSLTANTVDLADRATTALGVTNNAVGSGVIIDGAIVNADVNASAAIEATKIQNTALTEISDFAGDIDGTRGAITVVGMRGLTLPPPASSNDQMSIIYDHSVTAWRYKTSTSGGSSGETSTFAQVVSRGGSLDLGGSFSNTPLSLATGSLSSASIASSILITNIVNTNVRAGVISRLSATEYSIGTNFTFADLLSIPSGLSDGDDIGITSFTITETNDTLGKIGTINSTSLTIGTNRPVLVNSSTNTHSGTKTVKSTTGTDWYWADDETSVGGGGGGSAYVQTGSTNIVPTNGLNTIASTATNSIVAGGVSNIIAGTSRNSAILGGTENVVSNSIESVIVGGSYNRTRAGTENGFIGGGYNNIMGDTAQWSFIGGGYRNELYTCDYGFIGGGIDNDLGVWNQAQRGFIGGGQNNVLDDGGYSAIVGGYFNTIGGSGFGSTRNFIGGGGYNTIETTGVRNTIVGGGGVSGAEGNKIAGGSDLSFIGTGYGNRITDADHSFIGSGFLCTITNSRAAHITSGEETDILNSDYAFAHGWSNEIRNARHSWAVGHMATVTNAFSYLWNDGLAQRSTVRSNSYTIYAQGGVGINTNDANGHSLNIGGSMANYGIRQPIFLGVYTNKDQTTITSFGNCDWYYDTGSNYSIHIVNGTWLRKE